MVSASSLLPASWNARGIAEVVAALVGVPLGLLAGFVLQTWRERRSLPPGPWPYPFVGNFLQLLPAPHRAFQEMHKTYGPLLSVWYGSKLTIVLGDPNVVQQTHRKQSDRFQHRTLTTFAKLSLKADEEGGKNVALAGGKYWVKARKVFVTELMNKRFLEKDCVPKIMEEIWSAMDAIKRLNGTAFDHHESLQKMSANIVYRLAYGIRFSAADLGKKDSDWGQLHDIINAILKLGGQNVKSNYIPVQQFLDKLTPSGRELTRRRHEVVANRDAILQRILDDHKRNLVPENPRDFLDVLLTRQVKDGLSDLEIMFIAWEFITAGTDTTSATMHWLTLLMVNHPEVQAKAQREIDSVCKGRPVTMQDSDRLPYVNACVQECMRFMPAVPLMVPYKASADAEVTVGDRTYTIKKDTQVIMNGFNMHRDPELWQDPDVFNPERFMEGPDADIELKGADAPNDVHHLKFMPLGTGRRACAGYLLAKIELFLQGATLLQCFKWRSPEGEGQKVAMNEIFGIALSANHVKVVAEWRAECGLDCAAAVKEFGSLA